LRQEEHNWLHAWATLINAQRKQNVISLTQSYGNERDSKQRKKRLGRRIRAVGVLPDLVLWEGDSILSTGVEVWVETPRSRTVGGIRNTPQAGDSFFNPMQAVNSACESREEGGRYVFQRRIKFVLKQQNTKEENGGENTFDTYLKQKSGGEKGKKKRKDKNCPLSAEERARAKGEGKYV